MESQIQAHLKKKSYFPKILGKGGVDTKQGLGKEFIGKN